MNKKHLTVEDLYVTLGKLLEDNPDANKYVIWTEGCDCVSDVASIEIDDSEETIFLMRPGSGRAMFNNSKLDATKNYDDDT